MYMRYTQGQNEEYVLTIQECVLNQVFTIRLVYVHEVYTGTE